MLKLWLSTIFFFGLTTAQLCPPSASIAPCVCEDFTFFRLVCYQVATEAELRSIFSSPDYPTHDFDEIVINYGGFDSLGADLFGQLTADMLRITHAASLTSLDINLLRGPMKNRVRVLEISNNGAYNEIDLRILDGISRTDFYFDGLSNNAFNIIPPSVPTSIYSMNVGRNTFLTLRKDMFTNIENLGWLYIYESNITTIEPGTFAQFPSLQQLQLHRNNLSPSLEAGSLEMPNTLDTLVLDYNNIQVLVPDALSGFAPSAYISMWSNQLNAFSEASYRPILERLATGGGTLSLAYNYDLPCDDCSIVWLFLTPGLLDPLDQYMCDPFTSINDIDSGALIAACTP